MGVERAYEPFHTLAVAGNGELQLLQMLGVNELAHEQRVTRHVPHEAAEVLPLRRLSGAEQLGQGVLVGQLVPMAVVCNPESAHQAAGLGGQDDDGERGGTAPKHRTHHPQRHQESHRFDLAYVPMSCAVASTWPSMAASTSFFCAPALSFRGASSAYSLKK